MSLERRSWPMAIRTWTLIDLCWLFASPTEEGGVSSVEKPVGVLRLGISRIWP